MPLQQQHLGASASQLDWTHYVSLVLRCQEKHQIKNLSFQSNAYHAHIQYTDQPIFIFPSLLFISLYDTLYQS